MKTQFEDVFFSGTFDDSDVDYEYEEEDEGAESEDDSPMRGKKKLKESKKKIIYPANKIIMNVSDTQYPVVKFVGKKIFKWKLQYESDQQNWDLFWTDNAVQPETLGKMQRKSKNLIILKQAHQKINHFPGMYALARKNYLGKNLMKMLKQFPEDYKFFPPTWNLPADFSDFKNQFIKGKVKTFIAKPEASCQGKGIFLTRSIEDFNLSDHYVVQRYLHKPYLIEGLKFDLRIYVLLAGCDPLRIYLYKEGLTRFATEPYVAPHSSNLDNVCMHLTNYAINKDNPKFVFNMSTEKMDVGHKRSFTSTLAYLKEKGHDVETLMTNIKDIIIKTFCSIQPILIQNYRSAQSDNFLNNMCFEILGFDIILDHKCLKIYILYPSSVALITGSESYPKLFN